MKSILQLLITSLLCVFVSHTFAWAVSHNMALGVGESEQKSEPSDEPSDSLDHLVESVSEMIGQLNEELIAVTDQLESISEFLYEMEEFLNQKEEEYYQILGPEVMSAFEKKEAAYNAWQEQIEKENVDLNLVQIFDDELNYRELVLKSQVENSSFRFSSKALVAETDLNKAVQKLDNLSNQWEEVFNQREGIESKIYNLSDFLEAIRQEQNNRSTHYQI